MVVKKKKKTKVVGAVKTSSAPVEVPKKKKKKVVTSEEAAPKKVEAKPEAPVEKKSVTPVLVDEGKAITVAGVGKLTAKGALSQARNLYDGVERSLVVWAAVLFEIREKGYYKELEYGTYKDYIENEFRVSVRIAQDKVRVYKTLALEHEVEPSTLEKIGHCKALLISKGLEKGTIDKKRLPKILETAETITESELKSVINGAKKAPEKGKGEGEPNDPKTLKGDTGKQTAWDFNTRIVGKDAIELVRQAKEKMDTSEGKEVSQATFVERLSMEFLASTIDKAKPIQHYCRLLKQAYPDQHVIAVHKKHADKFAELARSLMQKPEGEPSKGAVPKKMKKKGENIKAGEIKVKKEK